MPILISTDAGQVKVGDTLLPGIFESIEVTGAVKMDEVEIRGKEQKSTQAVSYENTRIRLTVALVPAEEGGDCYDQVAIYQKVFRKSPDQQKPGVYQLVNKHAQARNISQVVFSNFQTTEDNKSDKVLATCEFMEHVPIQVKVATQKAAAASTVKTAPSSAAGTSSTGALGVADFKIIEYTKTDETPAIDNRESSFGASVLAWLKGEDGGG